MRTTAKWAQQWNSTIGDPALWAKSRDILHKRCAEIGRDPGEIDCSVNVRFTGDLGLLADTAAAFRDEGADIAIVNLPPPHSPEPLDAIAAALASLA